MTNTDHRLWTAADVSLTGNIVGIVLHLIECRRLSKDDGQMILNGLFKLWGSLDRFARRVRLPGELADPNQN